MKNNIHKNKSEAVMGKKTSRLLKPSVRETMRRNTLLLLRLVRAWHGFRLGLGMTVLWMTVGCAAGPPVLVFDEHGVHDATWHDFQIALYADGTVHYHGKDDVNVIGDRYGKIRPEQVQKMVFFYKKLYERLQQDLEKHFWPKYRNRHRLSPQEQYSLEEYKQRYVDDRVHDTNIFFNDTHEKSQIAPVGSYFNDFIGILNEMINLKPWLCFPDQNPRREYCPVLNHSTNYHLLMDDIK